MLNTVLIVPKLNPNTPTLMDGEVRLFKRKHSKVWQVAFTLDGRQVRVSSKKRIVKDAVTAAREIYLDYRFRQKNGLPVISKRFATYLAPLRKINWVVYAKQPFGGPEAVLAYLSRYTHRIAISNHRLISADADVVAFKWKDYRIKSGDRMKAMRLHTSEFIRRFLIHVLPSGFHRIRHTGFLANGIRRNRIEMIRRLLDVDPVADLKTDDDHCADANEKEQACPKCGGVMIVVETFKRGQTPKSRAPPWEDAA